MDVPKLQWSAADVHDGTLTVEIAGERPKGFKPAFQRTVALLAAGRWEDVRLKSGTIRVGGVREGDEEALRHFLESVMQEVASAIGPDESESDDAADAPGRERDDADARMTERFRAFAG